MVLLERSGVLQLLILHLRSLDLPSASSPLQSFLSVEIRVSCLCRIQLAILSLVIPGLCEEINQSANMSSGSDNIKGEANTTAMDGNKLDSFDGIDATDAEDNYHGHLGSTRNDNNDMDRMGKTQELRV